MRLPPSATPGQSKLNQFRAVAPITVLLSRGNVSDSLLILLLMLAADATSAALLTGSLRHLLLAGVWVRAGIRAAGVTAGPGSAGAVDRVALHQAAPAPAPPPGPVRELLLRTRHRPAGRLTQRPEHVLHDAAVPVVPGLAGRVDPRAMASWLDASQHQNRDEPRGTLSAPGPLRAVGPLEQAADSRP